MTATPLGDILALCPQIVLQVPQLTQPSLTQIGGLTAKITQSIHAVPWKILKEPPCGVKSVFETPVAVNVVAKIASHLTKLLPQITKSRSSHIREQVTADIVVTASEIADGPAEIPLDEVPPSVPTSLADAGRLIGTPTGSIP